MTHSSLTELFTFFLGKYIQIPKDSLRENFKLSQTTFYNVELRKDVELPLNVPVVIKNGSIGELSVSIDILSQKIKVHISDVNVTMSLNKYNDSTVEKDRKKKEKLESFELFTSNDGSSLKKKLLVKCMKNLVIEIENIRMNYTDVENSLGSTIQSLTIYTIEETKKSTQKQVDCKNIKIFSCNDASKPHFDDFSEILVIKEFVCFIDINKMENYKNLTISFDIPFIEGNIGSNMYVCVMRLLGSFGDMTKQQNENETNLRENLIENTKKIYSTLYNQLKQGNEDVRNNLENIEQMLEVNEIIYLRKYAQSINSQQNKDHHIEQIQPYDEKYNITFTIKESKLSILLEKERINEIIIGKIVSNLQIFGIGFHFDLLIDSLTITDNKGLFKNVFRKILHSDEIEQPFIKIAMDQISGQKQTNCLIKISESEVILSDKLIGNQSNYFTTKGIFNADFTFQFVKQKLSFLYSYLSNKLSNINQKQPISLTINALSPNLVLPIEYNNPHSSCVCFSLGSLSIFPDKQSTSIYLFSLDNITVSFCNDITSMSSLNANYILKDVGGKGSIILKEDKTICFEVGIDTVNAHFSKKKIEGMTQFIRTYKGSLISEEPNINPFMKILLNSVFNFINSSTNVFGTHVSYSIGIKKLCVSLGSLKETTIKETILNCEIDDIFIQSQNKETNQINLSIGNMLLSDNFNNPPLPYIIQLDKQHNQSSIQMQINIGMKEKTIFINSKCLIEMLKMNIEVGVLKELSGYLSLILAIETKTQKEEFIKSMYSFFFQVQNSEVNLWKNSTEKMCVCSSLNSSVGIKLHETTDLSILFGETVVWVKGNSVPLLKISENEQVKVNIGFNELIINEKNILAINMNMVGNNLSFSTEFNILKSLKERCLSLISEIRTTLHNKESKGILGLSLFAKHDAIVWVRNVNLMNSQCIISSENNTFIIDVKQTTIESNLTNEEYSLTRTSNFQLKGCSISSLVDNKKNNIINSFSFEWLRSKLIQTKNEFFCVSLFDCSIKTPLNITVNHTDLLILTKIKDYMKKEIKLLFTGEDKNVDYQKNTTFLFVERKIKLFIAEINIDVTTKSREKAIRMKLESITCSNQTLLESGKLLIGSIFVDDQREYSGMFKEELRFEPVKNAVELVINNKEDDIDLNLNINQPRIYLDPTIIKDLYCYIKIFIPDKINWKTQGFVEKTEKQKVLINSLIKIFENRKQETELFLTGVEFLKSIDKMNVSEYEKLYICDELIRIGVLVGNSPFEKEATYLVVPSAVDGNRVLQLLSFEPKNEHDKTEAIPAKKGITLSVSIPKLRTISIMEPLNENTPYFMFECDFDFVLNYSRTKQFQTKVEIKNTSWQSCVAEKKQFNYSGIHCNDFLNIVWEMNGKRYQNELVISSLCKVLENHFIFSFEDIKMMHHVITSFKKNFQIIKEEYYQTTTFDWKEFLKNPPCLRKPFNIYVELMIDFDPMQFIFNHPKTNEQLFKLSFDKTKTRMTLFNDDIFVVSNPIISLNYFNSNFGVYEEIVNALDLNYLFRSTVDIIDNVPTISNTFHLRIGNNNCVDFTLSHQMLCDILVFYYELIKKNHQYNIPKRFKQLYVMDQISTKMIETGLSDMEITASVEGGQEVKLISNMSVPITHDCKRQNIEYCYVKINGMILKIPTQTTVPQKHVYSSFSCIYSKMIVQEDGSHLIEITTQFILKNRFDRPMQIDLNKLNWSSVLIIPSGETRSVPFSFIGCDLNISLLRDYAKITLNDIKLMKEDSSKMFFFTKQKDKAIRVVKKARTFRGSFEYVEIELVPCYTIVNLLPRRMIVKIGDFKGFVNSGESVTTLTEVKSFSLEGEGTTTRVMVKEDVDYSQNVYKTGNGSLRIEWRNGEWKITSEYIIYNRTNETIIINNKSESQKIVLQPGGSGTPLTLNGKFIKIQINDAISHSIKTLTTGNLCIVGTKAYFIHIESQPMPEHPQTQIINISYTFFILNTSLLPMYLKFEGGIMCVESLRVENKSLRPVPFIPPLGRNDSFKKNNSNFDFSLAIDEKGPFSPLISLGLEHKENVSIELSKKYGDLCNIYVNVRPFNNGGCIVFEDETFSNCKCGIVNDTEDIVILWTDFENGKSVYIESHVSIPFCDPYKLNGNTAIISAVFLNGTHSTFDFGEMKAFPIVVYEGKEYYIYVYIINDIQTITFTHNKKRAFEECPLFHLKNGFDTTTLFDIEIDIPSVSVDLIDSTKKELIFVYLQNLNSSLKMNKYVAYCDMSIGKIQVDGDLTQMEGEEVILSIPGTIQSPSFSVNFEVIPRYSNHTFFLFQKIKFLCNMIVFNSDSQFINRAITFFSTLPIEKNIITLKDNIIVKTKDDFDKNIPKIQHRNYFQNISFPEMGVLCTLYLAIKDLRIPYYVQSDKLMEILQKDTGLIHFSLKNVLIQRPEKHILGLLGKKDMKNCIYDYYIQETIESAFDLFFKSVLGKLQLNKSTVSVKRIRQPRIYNPEQPLQRYSKFACKLASFLTKNGIHGFIGFLSDGETTWILTNEHFVLILNNKINSYAYSIVNIYKDILALDIPTYRVHCELNKEEITKVDYELFFEKANYLLKIN